MAAQGLTDAVCIITAPFQSTIGSVAYERRALAAGGACGITIHMVKDWWHQPGFLVYWTEAIAQLLNQLETNRDGCSKWAVVFSGHSLPVNSGTHMYVEHMEQCAAKIGKSLDLLWWEENTSDNDAVWTLAWQSAGPVGTWLEPTVEETIDALIQDGYNDIIFVPFGFVSDHVEVLYDNDYICKKRVQDQGGRYYRVSMPNGHRVFIEAMANAVMERRVQ